MSFTTRPSGLSSLSRLTFALEEPNYDEMTDVELQAYLEDSLRINKILTLENEIFERYLARHDPEALVNMAQVLETASKLATSQTLQVPSSRAQYVDSGSVMSKSGLDTPSSPGSISSHSISGSRIFPSFLSDHSSSRGFRITLSYRIEMVDKEIDEIKKQLATRERQIDIKKANLRAQLEEIELRIRDVHEAKKELEETVIRKGADPVTGKIPADKFMRYMETWIKTVDRVIDKLRLKSLSIKSQIKKAERQLQQREEIGQTLHVIDFEALAIENKEYLNKIREKNRELVDLKKVTGRYGLELNKSKNKFNQQQKTLDNIKKEIHSKENYINKLKSDVDTSKVELEHMEERIMELSKVIKDHALPDVLDFIKIQTELEEMKKTYKRIERHKNIQMTALKTFKKRQQLLQNHMQTSNPSESNNK